MRGFLAVTLVWSVLVGFADEPLTDGEIWNRGVDYYNSGDVTNALRVLRPLMLSRSHGPRAAEVVAKLEHERGNREEAASAAQIALRANPKDEKAVRNFTRATDNLLSERETKRIDSVLQAARDKDPGALLKAATDDARALFTDSGTYRTNAPARAVELADRYEERAKKLADAWIPVREVIVQSVTNEQQAATILAQLDRATSETKRAAKELGDLDGAAYSTLSGVEADFTRFFKLCVLPPAAMEEDLSCQSNALMKVENFNGRVWQDDALDYTRAFRAKFPMWARAYEQQAQSDTNKPPFTAEAQAKVSALATELEKIQLECREKPTEEAQRKAVDLIVEIRELLPKDGSGGGQGQGQSQGQSQGRPQGEPKDEPDNDRTNEPRESEPDAAEESENPEESDSTDREVDAILRKALERSAEHEAEKKARMRKQALPPDERNW